MSIIRFWCVHIRYGRLYRVNNRATVSFPSTIGGPQAVPRYSLQNISSPAGGEVAQVTGGCDEGGKPPRARLGEHDGLNLTWNNRTFCGVLCTVSAHATERMPGNDLRSPDGNHAGFARTFSLLS